MHIDTCLVPRRLSLAAKVLGAQGSKGRDSLLSPSRGSSSARPQFLVLRARLLATEIEAPEEEALANLGNAFPCDLSHVSSAKKLLS